MTNNLRYNTAPAREALAAPFGMYSGRLFTGGRALESLEAPRPDDWKVVPVSFIDAVTRNHDITQQSPI